ncbi:response regulator transcription factor [Acetobacteraceae bacterium H6797]|nr:response regulator transcription factor [Acetobacteraceae bacterium H6797]
MRVLLVDDEPLALDRLAVALAEMPDIEVVGTAADGVEALERIEALRPDIAILDVQMPGPSGMTVARSLAHAPLRPELVFVTAFDRYAADAFEVEAADYLLKPVRFDRLRAAMERARRRLSQREMRGEVAALQAMLDSLRASPAAAGRTWEDAIWVPGRQGRVRVPVASIDWVEAAKDYVMLNTASRSHILRVTMAALERRLDPSQLIRVHRSYFVRPEAVARVERPGRGMMRLLLRDGAELQVGPNYIEAVTAALRLP